MRKILVYLIIIIAMISTGCTSKISDSDTIKEDDMTVTILDVGKADCSIFQIGSSVIMIDTGEANDADTITSFLEDNNISTIDCMIITHFDKDHIGSASEIMNTVEVKQVLCPDYGQYNKDSNLYNDMISTINNLNIPLVTVTDTSEYNFSGAVFRVYPPLEDYYGEDEENDFSLVTAVYYGETSMLFTGDAEKARVEEIFTQISDIQFDFIKVPHHGVFQKNTDELLEAVNADYAVICCSEKENADDDTIAVLEEVGSKVYLTYNGDVVCKSDGTTLTVNQ